jgi:hypothetical protein
LSFRSATRLINEREGFNGFYRGFRPSVLKNTMNAGIYFGALNHFKGIVRMFNENDRVVNLVASTTARVM